MPLQPLFIVWSDIHDTGINIIDEQHRGIVGTINSLFYFINNSHGDVAVMPTLAMIEHYTQVHFLSEEELMAQSGYPGQDEHKQLHQNLVLEMNRIKPHSRDYNGPVDLLQFLKIWWTNHINKIDHSY